MAKVTKYNGLLVTVIRKAEFGDTGFETGRDQVLVKFNSNRERMVVDANLIDTEGED